jgi:hypothetical protein
MTEAQKTWLDDHSGYEAIGVTCSDTEYGDRGLLCADGTFRPSKPPRPVPKWATPPPPGPGSFMVGIKRQAQQQMPDPRSNYQPTGGLK